MSSSTKALDPAFQGVGQRPGTEIWRIENFQPVPLPKSDYGKFYMGDSYIVLQTTSGKGGAYLYDIHFWIGKDTSQDEAGTAAIKTVELDAVLGGRAVQHREIQGHESDKFLSYFKPCIIPLEGGVASGFKEPEEEVFETRLYVYDGKLDTESDSGEFWVLFGGFAPIGKKEFVVSQNRPKATRITRVIQGYETHSFKSNFDSWPAGSAAPGAEEGRGKVAALLKQQGVGVKGMAKSAPVNEEVPPLLEGGGKMEVWCINGSAKTPLPKEDIGKFYSGDCYIILYTYHSGDRKEDYLLYCWFGKDSIEEDQKMAVRLSNTMSNSLKGRPVQGRIFQGKEPPQFIALFQPMVVLKVATSLNSTECFLLQSGSSVFTWHGNQSTFEQQQLSAKIAEFLKPGVALKHAKEGTESSAFWFALGGKQSYTSKKASPEIARDPHLFTFSFNKGKFQVEEVYNFSQDDLLTEDILILDTHAEVFVWVGQSVDPKEKQNAFDIAQKYIEMAASLEGLAPNVPLYKVTEGNEPSFFTTFFSWDPTKAMVAGNSFQKKAALLFGVGHHAAEDKSNGNQGGQTQRASALAALSSAFNPSSGKSSSTAQDRSNGSNQGGPTQRASALAALNSAFNTSSGSKTAGKSDNSLSEMEGSEEVAEVKETEEVASVSESIGRIQSQN
ncbi:hypothetical protein GH714_033793 [Hevea brasiliensis]|uniref:Gelsolin-like domain-containing protein n=1 Tax=Hevea brasiliensis TaxID=3981 RepID=A0A6A6M554_HEVBR|nr:hypothetical protein GH714_033793 [Hevea brasiliensis]